MRWPNDEPARRGINPVRESLGAADAALRRCGGRKAYFEMGVRRSPKNARMLFGLPKASKAEPGRWARGWRGEFSGVRGRARTCNCG